MEDRVVVGRESTVFFSSEAVKQQHDLVDPGRKESGHMLIQCRGGAADHPAEEWTHPGLKVTHPAVVTCFADVVDRNASAISWGPSRDVPISAVHFDCQRNPCALWQASTGPFRPNVFVGDLLVFTATEDTSLARDPSHASNPSRNDPSGQANVAQ